MDHDDSIRRQRRSPYDDETGWISLVGADAPTGDIPVVAGPLPRRLARKRSQIGLVLLTALVLAGAGYVVTGGIRLPAPTPPVVAGATPPVHAAGLTAAAAAYRQYVRAEAGGLRDRTREFVAAVTARRIAAAKAIYPQARAHWEHIRVSADAIGDMIDQIDGHGVDLGPGEAFTGFHRLERDLWLDGPQPDTDAVAAKLVADITALADGTATAALTGRDVCRSAKELIDLAVVTTLAGRENGYAGTDLADLAARVEGSQAAVEALRPLLTEVDAGLLAAIDRRFAEAFAVLGAHRADAGFRPLRRAHRRRPRGHRRRPRRRGRTGQPARRGGAGLMAGADGISRRRMLGLAGGVVAAGAGAAGGVVADRTGLVDGWIDVVPFRGAWQAGITTAPQDHLYFVAFDVSTADRAELIDLLRRWTVAAERLTTGAEVAPEGAVGGHPDAPPEDTGEALGLPPARLTLTFGVGSTLFTRAGVDRFGLATQRPAQLTDLPAFAGDRLEPQRCGGDLCIQACADDPQVAVHSVRNLVRMGFGTVSVRWAQRGYRRTPSTPLGPATPRNMFGFEHGTNNVPADDAAALAQHVLSARSDGAVWMTGGSYLVARRIRMMIEPWDRTSLAEQEAIVGRTKGSGAPIGATDEFATPDLAAVRPDGAPLIGADSHVRLASAANLGGVRILRRGYDFVDGVDDVGHLDAGLFFLCFVRDPDKQFVPMQRALASRDRMRGFVLHTGSALFAIPPGVAEGAYWGQRLFDSTA